MNHQLSAKSMRKMVFLGVMKPTDYFKYKKLKRLSSKPTWTRREFRVESFSHEECWKNFRFKAEDLKILREALEIPQMCKIEKNLSCTGIEALCILLRRLSYPNRLFDLVNFFQRDKTRISRIFNWTLNRVYNQFAHLLFSMENTWLTKEKLFEFSEALCIAGSPYQNLVGFIDGTTRPICRPKRNQKDFYSGYKKCHVLKYQSIILPNGIIGRMDGPFQGKRHDNAILTLSKALMEMQKLFACDDGTWYCLYGDSGYANQKYIKVGFKNFKRLSQTQIEFNAKISSMRTSVEWGFGKILKLFSFIDYKKNQQLLLSPLKKQYLVATLLTNCHTCIYGSQTSKYFDCEPPTLNEYLA